MYIEPDSTLYILRNVPLDTTYDHTLWFDDSTSQANYFASLAKYRMEYNRGNALTYVRVNRGTIKVPYKADSLYDCNYIMFRNTGFGNKWFYAFIRSIEYVNNATSEITFEIDVMQTWHFDYEIDDCFVEREHSVTDVAGENTLPENVTIGDYVSEAYTPITTTDGSQIFGENAWSIVMARSSKFDLLNIPTTGGWYGGELFSQVEYDVYANDGIGRAKLEQDLGNLSIFNNQDIVVRIFMCPTALISPLQNKTEIVPLEGTNFVIRPTTIGSYEVKNKKLLTFPYVCCTLTNLQGQTVDLHYEYSKWIDGFIYIDWRMSFGLQPELVVTPSKYLVEDGVASEYRVTLSDFPDVPYATTDLYAKLVQKGIGITLGALTGNPATVTTSVMKNTKNVTRFNKKGEAIGKTRTTQTKRTTNRTERENESVLSQIGDALSDTVFSGRMNTSIGDTNAMANINRFGVYILKNHIREEYAAIIDDYFTVYGYATKRVKKPNRSSRPHWNYVKTIGCTLKGSVPCDDLAAICGIYDSGITFWKNGAEVGNYSLDNSPS